MKKTSPGYDEIYVKMIEAVEPFGMQWLYQLLREVWIRSRKPQDWYERTNVQCEISSSHGDEYDVQSCLLGYTAV
jgi:hypothetical protein